jgi:hypothetical protein
MDLFEMMFLQSLSPLVGEKFLQNVSYESQSLPFDGSSVYGESLRSFLFLLGFII